MFSFRFRIDTSARYYGYEGFPVVLPCSTFGFGSGLLFIKVEWSKCIDCGEHWTRFAEFVLRTQSTNSDEDHYLTLGDRGEISATNGDLTINDLKKSDEGLYRCDPTGPYRSQLQLIVSGWIVGMHCNYVTRASWCLKSPALTFLFNTYTCSG